jgi:hypothetical protein
MGWNGTGTYIQTDGVYSGDGICQSQAGDGDAVIRASEVDALFEDHADGIDACLTKNGENALTGNLQGATYRLTSTANTDAGTHGKDVASGAYSSPNITLTLNDSSTIDIDVSGLEAGTSGVDLTSAQTVAGIKTWSAIGSHAHVKFNGPTTNKVSVPTPGAAVTVDATATDFHYVTVGQNTTVDFTWPTAASDTQLGANWMIKGSILFRTTSAGKTITLDATMLAALDYYEEEGSEATGLNDLSTLVYTYWYINGTEIAQFAWVSTP